VAQLAEPGQTFETATGISLGVKYEWKGEVGPAGSVHYYEFYVEPDNDVDVDWTSSGDVDYTFLSPDGTDLGRDIWSAVGGNYRFKVTCGEGSIYYSFVVVVLPW
jgi:hypothetical protein